MDITILLADIIIGRMAVFYVAGYLNEGDTDGLLFVFNVWRYVAKYVPKLCYD